jgi:polysaccharide export outer membrane protein
VDTVGGTHGARRWLGAALLILLLVSAGAAWADGGPPSQSGAPEPFPGYKVGLGDRIQISVWGEPDLSVDAMVMPDGAVAMPLIGIVSVVGKTVPDLMGEIEAAYRRYLREPRISLTCVPRSPPRVYFEGAVGRPGPVDYDPRFRLVDYLGQAGGPSVGADLSRVIITSLNGADVKTVTVDMSPAKAAQGPLENPELKPGDTVWVGKALPVSVVGEVMRPGSFDYQQGLRLSDYLALSGGPTDHAVLSKVVLKSGGDPTSAVRVLDGKRALKQPDTTASNPVLAPGDVVTVPAKLVGGKVFWMDVVRTAFDVVFAWHFW